ncbi:MAG: DUF6541 family protein [Vicinamibacterales bacterium]
MNELTFALAILAWGLLPGLLVLWVAGVEWSGVERTAAAPGISLAVVAGAAYVAEVAGLAIRPVPVFGVVALLLTIVFALRRGFGGRARVQVRGWPGDLPRALRWLPWLVWLAPLVVVAQLEPLSSGAVLPPPLHDGLDHANWFRLIYEIGSLNPHEVMAPPLDAAGRPAYYPWGLHGWLALVAQTTSLDPIDVLMRAFVLISAALPLSVYAFTACFTGRGWTAMAAAALSLVFWWMPYQVWGWGGYPLLAGAIAALPVSRLALASAERRHIAAVVAAGFCMAGLLVIHPSQLFFALIITLVVSVTLASGGVLAWRAALPFVAVFATAAMALIAGGAVWPPLAEFIEKARTIGAVISGDPRYRSPIGPYFDTQLPLPDTLRTGLAAMAGFGAVVAIVSTRLRPLLVLHLVFGLLVLLARHHTWATSLWYHLPERIWYAQVATLPVLAAIGLAGAVQWITHVARRRIDLSRWQFLVWAVVAWIVFLPLHESFVPWANWRLYHAVHRNPQLALTDRRVLPDFAWMRANIPRGEILFNAPADWGLPLPFTGHRTIFWSGGYAIDPATPWNDFVALMRRGDPHTSHAGAELSARGIHYVYAGRLSTALQRRGREPLRSDALRQAAGFDVLYESPTATILRIPDVRPTLLPLRDTEQIRFEEFYPMEQDGDRKWRWTMGSSRVAIGSGERTGLDCFVRILGPEPDAYEVRFKGVPLEFTPRGHRIPALDATEKTAGEAHGSARADQIELEIVSPAMTPPAQAPDQRVLGVRVTNIGFACDIVSGRGA